MQTFEYKAYDRHGRSQRGLIEAADLKQAREKLAERGMLAERMFRAGAGGQAHWWRGRGFGADVRSVFYRELAVMLRAGLPLVPALDMLIQSPDMNAACATLAALRDSIKEGGSLADALARVSGQVGAYEKAVIAAGERAAALDGVLERLADFMDAMNQLRDRIITALIYPAMIFLVAVGVAVGLLGFAVPRIGKLLLEQSDAGLPFLTGMMINLGAFCAHWGLPLLGALAIVALGLWRNFRNAPDKIRALDRRFFEWPIVGQGYALLVSLRFGRTLALLLKGGVSLVEALPMAGEATGSPWIRARIEQQAEAVRHGLNLADMLRSIEPFAATLVGWAQVGESSGALAEMLEHAGARLQRQWERYLARRMSLIEPILILMIGVFVLLVVLAVLLPIFTLNRRLI